MVRFSSFEENWAQAKSKSYAIHS